MSDRFIPVEDAAKEWFKNPAFVETYDALEEEFALADALIKARSAADMTQADVAHKMARRRLSSPAWKAGVSCPRRGH